MIKQQVKAGVILSYSAQIVTLLSGLIYTPFMLRILGQSEFGVYQLATSVISYLGLLNFGFASGYLRIYFRYQVKKEAENISKLNGMFLLIFLSISVVCLFCGFFMAQNVKLLFKDGLTADELVKIKYLMLIMVVTLVLTFMSSVFDSYLSAFSQFVFQRGLQVAKAIFNPFLCLPLLLIGYGSVGITLVSLVLNLISLICTVFYCIFRLNMRFKFVGIEKRIFREISGFTFYIFLSTVVDKINLSLDNFLLGRMVNSVTVAVYGVGSQVNGFYNMISSSVAGVFAPSINKIVAESDDNKQLTDLFIKISKFLFLILSIVLIGFLFFGQVFIKFWAGEDYHSSYYIALILMIGCFIPLLQISGIEIQKAKNMHKVRSVTYFFIAIGNIFLSIPLIKCMGTVGAALGTLVTLLLGSGVFINIYYQKAIGLDMKRYWRSVLNLAKFLIVPILIGITYSFLSSKTIINTVIFFVLFTLSYGVQLYIYLKKAPLSIRKLISDSPQPEGEKSNKLKIAVVGAFDRYNYGDLLFPFIIENFILNSFVDVDYSIDYYGIRKFNASKYKAKSTLAINKMPADAFIINAGGNTLVAELQFLILDNIESKFLLLPLRLVRKTIGEEKFTSVLKKITRLQYTFPYDLPSEKMIFNAVGGDINQLPRSKRIYVRRILEESGFISLRDKDSYNALVGLKTFLTPDSAILISDIFTSDYLKANTKDKYTDSVLKPYIIFQMCESIGMKRVPELAETIRKLSIIYNMPVRLLPIGIAPSHGDIKVLSAIHKRIKDCTVFHDDVDIIDTTYLISNACMFIGSSLHGNLVSFSYRVPSVLIAEKGTKNYKYYSTWLCGSSVINFTLDEFISGKSIPDTINRNDAEINRQKALVRENFVRIEGFIREKLCPPDC